MSAAEGTLSRNSGRVALRRNLGRVFYGVCLAATLSGIVALAVLLITVASDGLGRVSWDFINSFPSRFPERAGIKGALWGSIWMMGFTAVIAIPLGVGAAIYLEEFARRNWVTRVIETNINNLAGVPSIIYGLLGLTVFVRLMSLGGSVLAGSLTMSLLVLPIIIVASCSRAPKAPSVPHEWPNAPMLLVSRPLLARDAGSSDRERAATLKRRQTPPPRPFRGMPRALGGWPAAVACRSLALAA